MSPPGDPKANSVVIPIAEAETPPLHEQKQEQHEQQQEYSFFSLLRSLLLLLPQANTRWLAHSAKVGLALVLVSLLFMLEAVHDRLGDNAMWAVMTVVVIFEFTSGKLEEEVLCSLIIRRALSPYIHFCYPDLMNSCTSITITN